MPITISNLTISNNVPAGATIGILTAQDASGAVIQCNYRLTKSSIGHFAIVGNQLVTAWSAPATPGCYSVRIHAIGSSSWFSGSATFTVNIVNDVTSPPPPPPDPSITVNGANNATVAEGTVLTILINNGTGNTTDWVGLAAAGAPDTAIIAWVYLNGTQTAPSIAVTSATVMMTAPTSDGAYEARFYPNDSWNVSARAVVSVAGGGAPPAPLPVITVTPTIPEVPDTTPLGAIVATYTVTMSDGSPFSGTIGFGAPNFDSGGIFALNGTNTSGNIIVNPAGSGVGPNTMTITDHITLVAVQP